MCFENKTILPDRSWSQSVSIFIVNSSGSDVSDGVDPSNVVLQVPIPTEDQEDDDGEERDGDDDADDDRWKDDVG